MLTYKMIEEKTADELFAIERKSVGDGWLRTLCPECRAKALKRREEAFR